MTDISLSNLFKQTTETIEKTARKTLPFLPPKNKELKTDEFTPNLTPPSKPSLPTLPPPIDFDFGSGL